MSIMVHRSMIYIANIFIDYNIYMITHAVTDFRKNTSILTTLL